MKKEFNLEIYAHRLQNEKFGISILILLWVFVQIIAYIHFDMRTSVDSDLYITNAIKLTQGELPHGREFFYLTYSLLIAIPYVLGLKLDYVIFFQMIVALVAIICIYKLTQHISKNNLTAFIAAILYVLWFKFQQWNLIMYTDAIFSSLVAVSTYALFIAHKKSQLILAFFLITFTILIRPTGIGLLFAVIVYLTYRFVNNRKVRSRTKISIYILAILISIVFLNSILAHFIDSFIASYSNAEIIYPKISLFVDKPGSFITPNENYQPLIKLLLLMIENPIYMMKITVIKGALFLGHIKPYYSIMHNVFIVGFLCPVYFFAFKGYKMLPKDGLRLFIASFVGFQFLIVSLTSENWDGRFLLPILPLIFLLSSLGISNYLRKMPIAKYKLNEQS